MYMRGAYLFVLFIASLLRNNNNATRSAHTSPPGAPNLVLFDVFSFFVLTPLTKAAR